MLLLLLACAHTPDPEAVDARFTALEEARASDAARIDALEQRVEQLETAVTSSRVGSGLVEGEAGALGAYTGSHCDPDGESDGFVLPPKGEVSQEALLASGRVVPHRAADGTIDGLRLTAIRRGSLLDSCGVRNGDILRSVEGMALTTLEELEAAHAAMLDRPSFTISLVRRGEPMQLVFRRPS
jgi:S1-C subfamily serine protease